MPSVFLTLNISTFSMFGVLVVVAPSVGAKILATRVSVPSAPSITSVLSNESLTVNVNVSFPVPPVNASYDVVPVNACADAAAPELLISIVCEPIVAAFGSKTLTLIPSIPSPAESARALTEKVVDVAPEEIVAEPD